MDLVIRANRAVIDGEIRPVAVAVADGVISAVGPIDAEYPAAEQILLPEATALLPGFVDTHVHINEPGTDWEGFATATAAAAAGGITTLVDMPLDSAPVTTSVDALREKRQAAQGNCEVDVAFWGGVVPDNLGDLADLAAAGVRGFKCFLTDSGNPNFPRLNPDEFRSAVAVVAAMDAVLLVHAESHHVIEDSPRPCGRGYSSFLSSRPDASEEDAVSLVIDAATETGARVHVVHVSSGHVLPMLAEAKRAGVRITAETCPHYLTFAAEAIPDGATQFAACPPIRDETTAACCGRASRRHAGHDRVRPLAVRAVDEGRRRLRQRVRRYQFPRGRAAGRVDARRRAWVRTRGTVPVDVRTARGPRGPRRQGTNRGRAQG